MQDENGKLCTQDTTKVSYAADGAEILGIASGDLVCEDIYTSTKRSLYHGKTVVVLKKLTEKAILTASAEGFSDAEVTI